MSKMGGVWLRETKVYLPGCVLGLWALIRIKECAIIRIVFTLQEATVCFNDDEEEKRAIPSQKDKRCAGVGEASTCDHTHITTGLTS